MSERKGYGLFVRMGDGKGGWVETAGTSLPQEGLEIIWGLALADVDRDGRPDIVVASGGDTGRPLPPRGAPPVEATKTADKGTRAEQVAGRTPPGAPVAAADVPKLQVWRSLR